MKYFKPGLSVAFNSTNARTAKRAAEPVAVGLGETDLVSDKPSDVTVRTITRCVLLTLSRKDLDLVLGEQAACKAEFQRAIDEHLALQSTEERQEWELVNSMRFGLVHSADPAMRISTRYGAPTPDDLDELLALVWKKPAFFLAHPKAIAAFARECTWRGVPPPTENLSGTPVITWRGVPLIPCDKLEIESRYQSNRWLGTTRILLLRVGEADQGVVGLHQTGIPATGSPRPSCPGSAKRFAKRFRLSLFATSRVAIRRRRAGGCSRSRRK